MLPEDASDLEKSLLKAISELSDIIQNDECIELLIKKLGPIGENLGLKRLIEQNEIAYNILNKILDSSKTGKTYNNIVRDEINEYFNKAGTTAGIINQINQLPNPEQVRKLISQYNKPDEFGVKDNITDAYQKKYY